MTNRNSKKYGILRLLFISLCFTFSSCENPQDADNRVELQQVRFDSVSAIVEAPSHIAFHNKYFEQEGLDIKLRINSAGKISLDNLFSGEADIVAVMGTPVVYRSFERNDFYIIGNIQHEKIHNILVRKDQNIHSAADLRGKKVGVMRGTAAEFFMDSFLISNKLSSSDLEIVNMKAPEQVEAISKKEIDAMFCWEPFPQNAKKILGEKGIILPTDQIVAGSWVIVVMKEYAHNNPEILKKFLRGITMAEKFIKNNKEEAISIHSKVSGVNREIVAEMFKGMYFKLSMGQRLLVDLEDQARWLIRYGHVPQGEVPNYLELVYTEALKEVKASSLSIIK